MSKMLKKYSRRYSENDDKKGNKNKRKEGEVWGSAGCGVSNKRY